MTVWVFTGSRHKIAEHIIIDTLHDLHLTCNDTVVTGACEGVDSQVAHLVQKYYPFVNQVIIVPANRKLIDTSVFFIVAEMYFMPESSTYRDRNIEMVKHGEKVVAFWTGKKIHSGTYMTINIAKKANKLHKIIEVKK